MKAMLFLVSLALLTPLAAPPAVALPDCDAASARLAAALEASPSDLTAEVVDALAETIDACEPLPASSPDTKIKPKTRIRPCTGAIQGTTKMQVIIAVPFVINVPYTTDAFVSYSRAGASEQMSARDIQTIPLTGFDVTPASGVVYLAGAPFAATSWGVQSWCGADVACATGHAAVGEFVQIWTSAAIGRC